MSPKSAPQLMQVSFNPSETAPHCLQRLIFEFRKLKLKNTMSNINKVIRKNSSKILPIMLRKKLSPKREIIMKQINETVTKVLLV